MSSISNLSQWVYSILKSSSEKNCPNRNSPFSRQKYFGNRLYILRTSGEPYLNGHQKCQKIPTAKTRRLSTFFCGTSLPLLHLPFFAPHPPHLPCLFFLLHFLLSLPHSFQLLGVNVLLFLPRSIFNSTGWGTARFRRRFRFGGGFHQRHGAGRVDLVLLENFSRVEVGADWNYCWAPFLITQKKFAPKADRVAAIFFWNST